MNGNAKIRKLSDGKIGSTHKILSISLDGKDKAKLWKLGVAKNAIVRIENKIGSVVVVDAEGTRIALDKRAADKIETIENTYSNDAREQIKNAKTTRIK